MYNILKQFHLYTRDDRNSWFIFCVTNRQTTTMPDPFA